MDAWRNIEEFVSDPVNLIIVVVGFIIGVILIVKIVQQIYRINGIKRDNELLSSVTSLNRGTRSERNLVLELLKSGIPAQTIFHDLYVKKKNGTFSQIDVVIATTEGIIVIEVKEYSGWIFGNGNYDKWTQVLAYGREKYRFFNPIKQNESHINALRKQHAQFENIPFYSIILFDGDCELKEIDFVPEGTFVARPYRLFEVLNHIKNNNGAANYSDKKEVLRVLRQAVENGKSNLIQEKHVRNINDMLGKERVFD